jgi:hypothetical protein
MNPLRLKLHSLIDEIVDAIEQTAAPEYVDQKSSPLGRRRHLELARKGVLKSTKEAGKVLIRRVDIERYLERKSRIVVDEKADEDREVAKVLAAMGRKNTAA